MTPRATGLWAFAAAGCAVALVQHLASGALRDAFDRFFGTWPQVALTLAITVAGLGALAFLGAQGWGRHRAGARGLVLIAALAGLFAAGAVAIDLLHPYPRDINVTLPAAIAFYPAIGFLAEILFHLLPLAILVALAGHRSESLLMAVILLAALPEPVFQVLALAANGAPGWKLGAMGLQLIAFGVFQLVLFRRYGFAAMYGARIVYYLIWHLAWGGLRLSLIPALAT